MNKVLYHSANYQWKVVLMSLHINKKEQIEKEIMSTLFLKSTLVERKELELKLRVIK